MRKYIILVIVLMATFGTMSARFDPIGQPQPDHQMTLGSEGDSVYEKVGFGCSGEGYEL